MSAEDLDLLAIGEALIDFISTEPAESLGAAEQFRRHLGGSPANIAVTAARLHGRAALAAKVGVGAFGSFVRAELERHGVITDYLRNDPAVHTTVIFVARTAGTPDFEAFRAGDAELLPADLPDAAIARARAVHASTFALSREPSRSTIAGALRLAAELGKLVSLDPNYHPQIWPDADQARALLKRLYAYVGVTKPSLDDAARLFGPGLTPETYIEHFHALGPRTVVLTMGRAGTLLSHDGRLTHIPARMVKVIDATGAGDAFWGGFLIAWLDRLAPAECVEVARAVVAAKLQVVGHGEGPIDRQALYRELGAVAAS